jgi:hypothetical protein
MTDGLMIFANTQETELADGMEIRAFQLALVDNRPFSGRPTLRPGPKTPATALLPSLALRR